MTTERRGRSYLLAAPLFFWHLLHEGSASYEISPPDRCEAHLTWVYVFFAGYPAALTLGQIAEFL